MGYKEDLLLLGLDPVLAPYSVLQLKQAYRKKCLEHHPDKNGNAADFIAITEAFQRLQEARGREASASASASKTSASNEKDEYEVFDAVFDILKQWIQKLVMQAVATPASESASAAPAPATTTPSPAPAATPSPAPATLRGRALALTVPVALSEIYNKRIKRCVVRVRDESGRYQREELYICLFPFQSQHIFHNKGDYDPATGRRGDIAVSLVLFEASVSLYSIRLVYNEMSGSYTDIDYTMDLTLYEFFYGTERVFHRLDGGVEVIPIRGVFETRKWPETTTYHHRVPGAGLPIEVEDGDEGGAEAEKGETKPPYGETKPPYGDAILHYKVSLPAAVSDALASNPTLRVLLQTVCHLPTPR